MSRIPAASAAERVVGVDSNRRAVGFARLNGMLGDAWNAVFVEGDLYGPVAGERFNLILANPPFVASPVYELAFRDGGPSGADGSVEFLCKFEYLSHRKREWLPLWAVREAAEGKLRGHWKRHRASLQNPEVRADFPADYLRPERVVAVESGEMLVKWHGLGYDEATWEPEEDASEAAVAAAANAAKRRDEEEQAARADAGSPGKTAEARAAAAAARGAVDAEVARRAVVDGLGESDDSGDEADAEALEALEAARERRPEGYGNADIAAELAAELAAGRADNEVAAAGSVTEEQVGSAGRVDALISDGGSNWK